MQDLRLYGVETYRGQRHRYQTALKLLIYRGPFGNYGRVTDTPILDVSRSCGCGSVRAVGFSPRASFASG